jgi:hypothetical protein
MFVQLPSTTKATSIEARVNVRHLLKNAETLAIEPAIAVCIQGTVAFAAGAAIWHNPVPWHSELPHKKHIIFPLFVESRVPDSFDRPDKPLYEKSAYHAQYH